MNTIFKKSTITVLAILAQAPTTPKEQALPDSNQSQSVNSNAVSGNTQSNYNLTVTASSAALAIARVNMQAMNNGDMSAPSPATPMIRLHPTNSVMAYNGVTGFVAPDNTPERNPAQLLSSNAAVHAALPEPISTPRNIASHPNTPSSIEDSDSHAVLGNMHMITPPRQMHRSVNQNQYSVLSSGDQSDNTPSTAAHSPAQQQRHYRGITMNDIAPYLGAPAADNGRSPRMTDQTFADILSAVLAVQNQRAGNNNSSTLLTTPTSDRSNSARQRRLYNDNNRPSAAAANDTPGSSKSDRTNKGYFSAQESPACTPGDQLMTESRADYMGLQQLAERRLRESYQTPNRQTQTSAMNTPGTDADDGFTFPYRPFADIINEYLAAQANPAVTTAFDTPGSDRGSVYSSQQLNSAQRRAAEEDAADLFGNTTGDAENVNTVTASASAIPPIPNLDMWNDDDDDTAQQMHVVSTANRAEHPETAPDTQLGQRVDQGNHSASDNNVKIKSSKSSSEVSTPAKTPVGDE